MRARARADGVTVVTPPSAALLHAARAEWIGERVVATAFMDDQQVARSEKSMEELQNF